MRVASLELRDFRCYESAVLELPAGCTVVAGANGEGKTSLLEALAWAANGHSLRPVPDSALVRSGAPRAVVRVEVEEQGRTQTLEAELAVEGRGRIRLNGRPVARRRDLAGFLLATVFTPDDLVLVKGGPAQRREYLDDLLVAIAPRFAGVRADLDRVVRQRNALLRSGARDEEALHTLDVFDEQLASAGAELVRGRLQLVARLGPRLTRVYEQLAGEAVPVEARYRATWADDAEVATHGDPATVLRAALQGERQRELERGVTLVGPHRDDWDLTVNGLAARVHASQGEQRSLSLGLRLAGHDVVRDSVDREPVLLLDDVFSELDDRRAAALVRLLPGDQTLVTTAGTIPEMIGVRRFLRVAGGRVEVIG